MKKSYAYYWAREGKLFALRHTQNRGQPVSDTVDVLAYATCAKDRCIIEGRLEGTVEPFVEGSYAETL